VVNEPQARMSHLQRCRAVKTEAIDSSAERRPRKSCPFPESGCNSQLRAYSGGKEPPVREARPSGERGGRGALKGLINI